MPTALRPQQPPHAADEASAGELLRRASEALRTRRLAEVAELELAVQWAVVNTTRVVGPGRHLWQTPHGLVYLVDHTGTRRLTEHQAAAMAEAPDGVELYFTLPLDYAPPSRCR